MRLLSVLVTACSAVLLLAACGTSRQSAPRIDRTAAQQLAAESDAIASAPNQCDAAHRADHLQTDVERAITAGHVPAALRAELRAKVTELVNELTCTPPPQPENHKEKDKHEKKRKGHH